MTFLVTLIINLFYIGKPKKIFIFIWTSIAFISLAFVFLPMDLIKARLFQSNLADGSTKGHYDAAVYAVEMFKESPFFGVGLGNYQDFLGYYFIAHNVYLQNLAETGLFGLLSFILLLSFVLLIAHRKILILKKLNHPFQYTLLGVYVGYLSILFGNITYDYFMQYHIWFHMVPSRILCNVK